MNTGEGVKKYAIAKREIALGNPHLCVVCGDIAWTDYYGNYACKTCCNFFVDAVMYRKTFRCLFYNICSCYLENKHKCHFCWFKMCFLLGLNTSKVGLNYLEKKKFDDNFLKSTRYFREKATVPKLSEVRDILAIQSLGKFIELCEKEFYDSQPPILFKPAFAELLQKYRRRDLVLVIVFNSVFMNGNIMLHDCLIDPFKCTVTSIQNLALRILDIIELFEKYFESGMVINHELLRKLTYFKELDMKDLRLQSLQLNLTKIIKYVELCELDIAWFD